MQNWNIVEGSLLTGTFAAKSPKIGLLIIIGRLSSLKHTTLRQKCQLLRMPQCNGNAYRLFATFTTYDACVILGKILSKSGILEKYCQNLIKNKAIKLNKTIASEG